MDTEASDFQTAWERACKQANIALLEASLEGLGLYYEMRMRFRGGEQACRAGLSTQAADLQEASTAVVLRARLLLWQASFQVALGELEPARQSRQEGEKLLDQLEPQGFDVRRPRAMYWQAEGEDQTDLQIKLDYFQRGIALFQELGDTWRQAEMLIWAGEFAMRLGNGNQALQYQEEALRLSRQLGEPNLLLHSLRQINYLYFILNQVDHAHQIMQETAEFIETVEELPLRANAQMHMGGQLVWSGSFPEAIRSYESALPVLRRNCHGPTAAETERAFTLKPLSTNTRWTRSGGMPSRCSTERNRSM